MNPSGFHLLRAFSLLLGSVLSVRGAQDYASPYVVAPFVGEASIGSSDGRGKDVRFNHPRGLATDPAGNVYVADTDNQTIRRIASDGTVTTVAGLAGVLGGSVPINGQGSVARFSNPTGMARDATGNLLVADFNGYSIRKVTPGGLVSTHVDRDLGPDHVAALAFDPAGNLFFGDWSRFTISRLASNGTVSPVAGKDYSRGNSDGVGEDARFSGIVGLAADAVGNLFVSDQNNDGLRRVTPDRTVSTIVDPAGVVRFNDAGLATEPSGSLLVAARSSQVLARVTPAGSVTILAGKTNTRGHRDGPAADALFNEPAAVALDGAGNIFVAEYYNNVVRKITPAGAVSTLAGLPMDESLSGADGTGTLARFGWSNAVAFLPSGDLVVADTYHHTIRKVSPAGVVTTWAGQRDVSGYVDGPAGTARFSSPFGLAVDPAGNVYVLDGRYPGNNTPSGRYIRKITPAGEVSTVVPPAKIFYAETIAVDAQGYLYASEYHSILRIAPNGTIELYAGQRTQNNVDQYSAAGHADGPGGLASFYYPWGLAFDRAGNLYVADFLNDAIRKITPDRQVSTLAGTPGEMGSIDGTGSSARLSRPIALSVDGDGNLYVTESATGLLRKVTPAGVVTTLAGLARANGTAFGVGSTARLMAPDSIAAKADGTVFITSGSAIVQASPANLPAITAQPQNASVAGGGTVQFAVLATGNPAPTYQWYFNGNPFTGATSATLSFAGARSTDAGDYTVMVTNPLGSLTSAKATLTVTAAPAPPPPASSGGSGGGGGAPSWWFLAGLTVLALRQKLAGCFRSR